MLPIDINNDNFVTEVLNSPKPILLDFWAEWCAPCRMLAPTIDQIASEQDAVRVGKVDVTNSPELAAQFGVMSIPLLVLVNDGKIVAQLEGAHRKETILDMMAPYMK